MNEKAILASYNLAVQNGYKKSIDEFKQLLSSNSRALDISYNLALENGYKKTINDYKVLMGLGEETQATQDPIVKEPVKKKEDTTESPLGDGSSASSASADDLSSLAVEVQDKSILTKQPRESKPIVPSESTKVVSPRIPQTEPQPDEIDRKVESLQQEKLANEYNEIDYFQGTFGNVLRGFDDFTGTGLGDVADDLARSFATGIAQGNLAEAGNKIIRSGNEFTEEDIQNIIQKAEAAQQLGSSKEFQDYLKTYEAEGKTIWGAVKGLMENPTVFPEVMTSSIVSMATNKEAVLAGVGILAGAFGTGAAVGGTAGTFTVPGVGTAIGAAAAGLSAAASALPFAFGAASTVVETGSVFAQGLQEQLGTDENGNPIKPTKENVRAILEDPEKYNKIKNDAILRGFTVGIIDAVGGKLATGVGAKILRSSAKATGNFTKAGVVKALAAGGVIEGAAGGTGEALGQVAIGKPIDTGNVILEIAAEMPGALRSTLMASLKVPTYKINKGKVSAEEIDRAISTMTPEQLAASDIEIYNDFEGRKKLMQDKIVTGALAKDVREANPNLNDATVDEIVSIQKQLNILEGNKTQVAKDRAAEYREQIKYLTENQLPDAVQAAPTTTLTEELAQSIAAQETIQETKPTEQDAIQEQAAGQVPVQPTTTVGQEVEQGVSQAEPQVTAQAGVQEEVKIDIDGLPTEGRPSLRGSITTPNSERGYFNANTLQDGTAYIADIQIGFDENASRGRGYGTNAYIQIGKKLKELGYSLESTQWDKHTSGISPQALRVWEKLTELGYAKVIGQKKNKVYNRETGAEEVKTTPVYEFVAPQAEPQVTAEAGVQEEVTTKIPEPKTTATFADELSAKYGVELELQDNETDNSISVPKIVVPKDQRKTGIGTKVMEEIIEFADSSGKRLILTPSTSFGGSSVKRLVEFYKSLGFVENKGKNKDFTIRDSMYRNPVPVAQEAAVVSPAVSPLTQEQQMASMEQMFSEEKIPATEPVQFEGATLSDPIQVESLKKRVQDKGKKSVVDFAQKTLTTLKSVLPNFEIVVHDDENSYINAMNTVNGNAKSAGYFSYIQRPDGTYVGKIDINLNKANNATVAHEVAHGVMRKAFGENVESFRTLKNRIAAVLNQEGNQALTDFANQYEENDSYEEYLVELAAQLTQTEKNLSPTVLQNIASIINEVVSKITNGAFTPFQNVRDTKQTIEFFRNISESIRKGEAINPSDITAIQEGLSVPIGSPTTITPAPKGKASLNFTKTPLPLSFVTEADKIDINALIDDIVAKKQKIWFWMADQLGRGNYYDEVVGDTHYLDAGPSFALDPANRSKGILWASGLPEKTLTNQINQADYIFFISGSPEKAKLFNKRVLDLLAERINKNSDFNKFKEAINNFKKETVELRTIKEALNEVNSFKELADSPKRKSFLISIGEIGSLKTAPTGSLKELLGSFNAFIDYNELRDGFYRENDFNQNDIMLVGKPTGVSGKAPHSTYEFAISGEVVGVPDKKIDSWNIMPESIKEKYKDVIGGREEKTKPMQTKVIAAETGVIRELEPRIKGKAQLIGENANLSARVKFNLNLAKAMETTNMTPKDIRFSTGWEKGKDKKWRYEILDGKFKDIDLNDLKKELDIQNNDAESRVAILGDVFSAPDLYAAYPEAKNIKVVFKDLGTNNFGGFTPSENKILINKNYYNTDIEAATLTTLHEIQHYIQTVEVFEPGQAPSRTRKIFDSIINVVKYEVNETKKILKEVEDKFFVNKDAVKKAREAYKLAYGNYKLIKDLGTSKEVNNKREYIKRLYGKNLDLTSDSDFNLYLRAAGEVEARNVEVRNALTPEQRKRTLLFETEDVRREDQVLFDNYSLMLEQNLNEIKNEFKGKAQLDTDSKAKKVVQQARAQGFSEDVIRLFLQGKGISEADINKAMETDIPAAGKITLSEETISGYDSLMKKLKNLIVNGMPLAEVISKLKNSKTYIDATDVQKEKLVREVRKMGGVKEKSAPRAGRLIGIINDITKITMTEKEVLNKRIKDLAEGAKDAVKGWRKITSDLAKEIKALAKDKSGKLTARQVTSVTTRLAELNAFNEQSVKDFIDYMAKVFADAEYRDTIDGLRSKIAKAKKNITSKIGIANTLKGNLNKLLSINPLLIPDAYLDRYVELVEMLGANQQVLELEQYDVVKSDTEAILRAVDEEQSKAYELADVLENSDNKVYTKSGELDYAATLKEMVKQGEITEEEADLMRKYKKEIVPQDEKQKLSEEEIKEKKEEAIKAIKAAEISGIDELPSVEERQFAQKFAELLKNVSAENLMKLGLNDLRNLLKVIDNINNNYLPSYAYQVSLKIDGIRDEAVLDDASSNATPPIISTAIGKIKNLFTNEGALLEAIKRIPLFNIDQVLGNFKGKEVFNALLLKTAQAEAKYKAELKRISSVLEKAEQKVAKSFSFDQNKIALSKMKMMTYMRQLEYESNQGNEQVNPAMDYLNKTIEHIEKEKGNKIYGKIDLENLKYIRAMFQTDGQINLERLYNSLNQSEKDAVNDIKKINESLRSKAEFTSNIIRGKVFDGLDNYLHLIVLGDNKNSDIQAATDITNAANSNMNPSTKAKSLEKRTKGAKPISFDVFASASRGAKYVLLDYNLTGPIKTARIALNQLEKTLDERKNVTKLQREVTNALRKAYNEAVDNLLINNIMDETTADQFVDYVSRMGYRSVLAGTGRFAAELTSNVSFAILAEPQAFIKGTTYANIIMSQLGPLVMENISSTQTNRIFPEDSLSGNFMDTSAMRQRVGLGSKAKSPIVNKIQQGWNLTGKKYTNAVEVLADNMISTPDKVVMRALWFGSFANEFKKAAGKDVDFKLIGENNEKYLKDNKEAIEKARAAADQISVQAGATDNSFMGILKGVSKPNQSTITKAYNNFNSYMTRFLIFEFMSARTGVYAMVGAGPMSRTKGAMLLAAVATRMTVYSMLSRALADGIIGLAAPLFGIEDEEEEEDKSFLQSVGQAITGTVGSLFFGRDFGNTVKMVTNLGLEYFNEEYLDFLREGEYDQYEDAIAYSIIPRSKEDKSTVDDFLFRLGGSFGPALQTGKLVGENLLSGSIQAVLSGGTTKKEAAAIERERRVVTQRIPLEILGNLSFIPLYKDIRRAVNKSIYADLKNTKVKTEATKAIESPASLMEKREKLEDLRAVKDITIDEEQLKVIRRKIIQINGTDEQKDSVTNYNKRKEEQKKILLYDSDNGVRYDNETEMERYNKRLYIKRFGRGSEWNEKYKAEDAVRKKLTRITRKREDEEYGYRKKN